jgi:Ca2+-binding RTX toxin-like protein
MPEIYGTADDDVITGSDQGESIYGEAGDDELHGKAGDDYLLGDSSGVGEAGDDFLFGEEGDDWIAGYQGADLLNGGAGDDYLRGHEGDDRLDGGAGNDFLGGGSGIDHFDGGSDDGLSEETSAWLGDRISFFNDLTQEGVVADLRTGVIENDGFGNRETMIGIESLGGGSVFIDFFYGNDVANLLLGGTGDTLLGFGGNDLFSLEGSAALLDGGDGVDTFLGFSGIKTVADDDGDGRLNSVRSEEGVTVDLAAERTVDGYGDTGTIRNIENFSGTRFDDILVGNGSDNVIRAVAGSDRIEGGAGSDTVSYADSGELEHYRYHYDGYGAVEVDLAAGYAEESDMDTWQQYPEYRTPPSGTIGPDSVRIGRDVISGMENIIGGGLGDRLLGDDGDNIIAPGAGDDFVSGRGGSDTIDYSIARGAVVVDLGAGVATQEGSGAGSLMLPPTASGGVATVTVAADDAGRSKDRLVSIENAIGSNLSDTLIGSSAVNHLRALAGRDILGGGGGDLLDGGAGTDRVDYSSASSAVTVDLGARTGSIAGVAASDRLVSIEDATGSAFADTLIGNTGTNRLDGGVGIDKMSGGRGGDVYVVDSSRDNITEGAGAGTDRIESSVTLTLTANVEHLTLTGEANIGGTGNGVANRIVGNSGSNRLDGGLGADDMRGGAGDDVYQVDDLGDKVVEALDQGSDRVEALVSVTLGVHLEGLVLNGDAHLEGTGNGLSNRITGNSGNNALAGLGGGDLLAGGAGNDRLNGGTSNDRLEGGEGLDSFLFDTALNGRTNVDTILDFVSADDTIRLDRDVFTGVSDGRLAASAFHAGTEAKDASDRILYDQATGNIFYDADGSGNLAAVLFARVDAGTTLTSADFAAYI